MSVGEPLEHWLKMLPVLNEAQRRWYAAVKAIELGRGGIERVHEVTGMSRPTIRKGIREIIGSQTLNLTGRIRRRGAGRPRREATDPSLMRDLESLLDASTAGDPMSALKWTSKSTRTLAKELMRHGHDVSAMTVDRLLSELDYSQQGNRKNKEGLSPPERDEQFRNINAQVKSFMTRGEPVLSIDCKKKERVGEFKNPGKTWRRKGDPVDVNIYDFPRLGLGSAIPYGLYDLQYNDGLVNVGISHETAEFAVESIRQWWRRVGRYRYSTARRLLLCADGGGSNGSRNRGWKFFLQTLADETCLSITVCHYPPGTSKWNKIEHRMFSFISLNWRGQPLVSYETVINLIGNTRTEKGLKVSARLDMHAYPKARKISTTEMETVRVKHRTRLPQWNYTIRPHPRLTT
ncbi:MAG: ISAzo13 family transposase [Polyangiaceae bacterium]